MSILQKKSKSLLGLQSTTFTQYLCLVRFMLAGSWSILGSAEKKKAYLYHP
jgi:hypothetical protein